MSIGRHLLSDPSHGMRQLMCARREMYITCRVLRITCFVFQRLAFSDTDEDKNQKWLMKKR